MGANTKLIHAHIAREWHDYTPADLLIGQISDETEFTHGAQDAGAVIGDWIILTHDGSGASEIVRIVDGSVISIHSTP